jgi:hypothetical protein
MIERWQGEHLPSILAHLSRLEALGSAVSHASRWVWDTLSAGR